MKEEAHPLGVGGGHQFFLMTPFIGILVVMWLFKKKVEFPAALGKPYSRE